MHDFLRMTVHRPFGSLAEAPAMHITEEPPPRDGLLRGRPGLNGGLLLWFAGNLSPTEVPVVDGLVSMPVDDLIDAVLVKTVPPTFEGGLASYADRVDGLNELAATIMLNAAYVVDVPDVMH